MGCVMLLALAPARLSAAESEPDDEEIPSALLAMAEQAERERDAGFAIEAYERFLALFPYDPRHEMVAARLTELRKAPTLLRLEGELSEATIWLNGIRVGGGLPSTHELQAGRYDLLVIARDGRRFEMALVLPPGSTREVSVRFRGSSEDEWNERFGVGPSLVLKEEEKEPVASADDRNRFRGVVFAMAGVTAGALVATTTLGLAALFEEERFGREPSFEIADRGERLAISADVFLAMSVASGITAVILHFKGKAKDEKAEEQKASVSFAPMLSPGGGGLQLVGRIF